MRTGRLQTPLARILAGQLVPQVAAVAAEHLVAAVAGQGHGDVGLGQLGQVVDRDSRRVGEGLAVVAHQLGQDGHHVGRHHQLVVVGLPALGHHPGPGRLPAPAGKIDGEGLDRPRRPLGHQRHHQARVEPAAEEGAHRDVRHLAPPDRLIQQGPHLLGGLLLRGRGEPARRERQLPVALQAWLGPRLDHQQVPGRQLANPLPRRPGWGDVLQGQVSVDGRRVHLGPARQTAQPRGRLGRKRKALGAAGEEDRLLAQGITGQQQAPAWPIPQREGEHPPQRPHEVVAPLLVQVNDDLRVRAGSEAVPPRLQVPAQLGEVVDLAVDHRPDGAVLVGHGLVPAGRQVDDGQAPVPQHHRPVVVIPSASGPRWARAAAIARTAGTLGGPAERKPQMPHIWGPTMAHRRPV